MQGVKGNLHVYVPNFILLVRWHGTPKLRCQYALFNNFREVV